MTTDNIGGEKGLSSRKGSSSSLFKKSLKDQALWFKTIFDEASIGIEIYDKQGTLIHANSTTLYFFGVENIDAFQGWNIFEDSSLTDGKKEQLRKGLEVMVDNKRDFDKVKYRTTRTGIAYFEASFKAVSLGDTGVTDGYIGLVRDVTEIKRFEAQRRDYTEQLEDTIVKRSNALVEAERITTAGRIASMVGHDLRSPLQSVKNAVYVIRQRPEYTDRMLTVIECAVDRALKMLDELRQTTRGEPLVLKPTNINQFVEQVIRELPLPPTVAVTLDSHEKIVVRVDQLKLRRVLENLISNAVEAMGQKGKVIVTLREVEGGVEISVRDHERGMSPETISQLFKPFFTTKPVGMGLGLAFCKRAVGAHGGNIEAWSVEGEGTTVTITLPSNNQVYP